MDAANRLEQVQGVNSPTNPCIPEITVWYLQKDRRSGRRDVLFQA